MRRTAVIAKTLTLALPLAGLLVGCRSAPPPVERMEASSAAIRAASEIGATHVPEAALHLQLAKEEAEQAKVMVRRGERKAAVGLLMRAEADAELAVALSRENSAKSEAQQAMDRIRAFRQNEP